VVLIERNQSSGYKRFNVFDMGISIFISRSGGMPFLMITKKLTMINLEREKFKAFA